MKPEEEKLKFLTAMLNKRNMFALKHPNAPYYASCVNDGNEIIGCKFWKKQVKRSKRVCRLCRVNLTECICNKKPSN